MDVSDGDFVVFVKEIVVISLFCIGSSEYWKLELEEKILVFEKEKE